MIKYPKIENLFERDPETHKLTSNYKFPGIVNTISETGWTFSEKLDGMNMRLERHVSGKPLVYGRTDNAEIKQDLVDLCEDIVLRGVEEGLTLFGEGIGPKIQSGAGYCEERSFVLFDVWTGSSWLSRKDVFMLAQSLNIDHATEYNLPLSGAVHLCKAGFKSDHSVKYGPNGGIKAEGLIARPLVEMRAKPIDRVIFKIKSKDFETNSTG